MKKILILALLACSLNGVGQPIHSTTVEVRDSLLSLINNTDLVLHGKGTGKVNIEGNYTLPSQDGAANQVLTTDGLGALSFSPRLTLGALGQVPYVNSGGTDFDYGGVDYDGVNFKVERNGNSNFQITSSVSSSSGLNIGYTGDESVARLYRNNTTGNLHLLNASGSMVMSSSGDINFGGAAFSEVNQVSSLSDLEITATGNSIIMAADNVDVESPVNIDVGSGTSETLALSGNSDLTGGDLLNLVDTDVTAGNSSARIVFSDAAGQIGRISGVNFAGKGITIQNSLSQNIAIFGESLSTSFSGNISFTNGTTVIPSTPDHVNGGLRNNSGTLQISNGSVWSDIGGSGAVSISGTPVANDFARWTNASTIEGRSYAETRSDLGLNIGAINTIPFSTGSILSSSSNFTFSGSSLKVNSPDASFSALYLSNETNPSDVAIVGLGDPRILAFRTDNVQQVFIDANGNMEFTALGGSLGLPESPSTPIHGLLRYNSDQLQIYSTTHPAGWRDINSSDALWDGTPLSIANGGTGAVSASAARTNLGLGTMAIQNASAVVLTGNMTGTTAVFSGDVTATDFVATSDVQFKENINKIGGSDIEYLTYNFKGSDTKRIGVSAQQVQEVLPEVVREIDGHLAVSYIDLLIHQIAKLEARIQELEKR